MLKRVSLVHARVQACKVVSRFSREDANANADKTTHTLVHIFVSDLTQLLYFFCCFAGKHKGNNKQPHILLLLFILL